MPLRLMLFEFSPTIWPDAMVTKKFDIEYHQIHINSFDSYRKTLQPLRLPFKKICKHVLEGHINAISNKFDT